MTSQQHLPPTEHNPNSEILYGIRRCSLEVIEGPDRGAKIQFLPEYTLIGRGPSCHLVLTDAKASVLHCEIKVAEDQVVLKDLGSTNGTRCGGVRVVEAFLEPDSVFQVGDTSIRLEVHSGSQPIVRMPCDPTGKLIGSTPAMQELFALMTRLAPHPVPVVLLGETGTGKTLAAQALHQLSPRKAGPFVSINCANLEELTESTLFGYEKNAWDRAIKRHPGVFEQANGGTLLLDEIAELPPALQPKLLQVLETGLVRPLGAECEVKVNVRLIAATNRPLAQAVREKRFRQDLYYRIAGMELVLPPLRERLQDLELLTQHLLQQQIRQRYEERRERFPAETISPAALRKLARHPWPGNVRELNHTLDRALVLARGPTLEPGDISFVGCFGSEPGESPSPWDPQGLEGTFEEFKTAIVEPLERTYLERLMERAMGNKVHATGMAGIARSHLRKLLKKHGLME